MTDRMKKPMIVVAISVTAVVVLGMISVTPTPDVAEGEVLEDGRMTPEEMERLAANESSDKGGVPESLQASYVW